MPSKTASQPCIASSRSLAYTRAPSATYHVMYCLISDSSCARSLSCQQVAMSRIIRRANATSSAKSRNTTKSMHGSISGRDLPNGSSTTKNSEGSSWPPSLRSSIVWPPRSMVRCSTNSGVCQSAGSAPLLSQGVMPGPTFGYSSKNSGPAPSRRDANDRARVVLPAPETPATATTKGRLNGLSARQIALPAQPGRPFRSWFRRRRGH